MATNSLYERYKDALRRGHVASLRGRLEAAVGAYSEAAAIAPDRALPHAAIGGILVEDEPAGRGAAVVRRRRWSSRRGTRPRCAARPTSWPRPGGGSRRPSRWTGSRTCSTGRPARRRERRGPPGARAGRVAARRRRSRRTRPAQASAGDEAAAAALARVLRVLEPPIAPAGRRRGGQAEPRPTSLEPTRAETRPRRAESKPGRGRGQATEAAESVGHRGSPRGRDAPSSTPSRIRSDRGDRPPPRRRRRARAAVAEPEPEPEPEPVDAFVVGARRRRRSPAATRTRPATALLAAAAAPSRGRPLLRRDRRVLPGARRRPGRRRTST